MPIPGIYDLMPAMTSPFQTIAIIGKYMNPEIREQILTLAQYLTERRIDILNERGELKPAPASFGNDDDSR